MLKFSLTTTANYTREKLNLFDRMHLKSACDNETFLLTRKEIIWNILIKIDSSLLALCDTNSI